MRVLVACEYSGRVRDAMLAKGHDAVSCDLVPSEIPGPHHVGDVLPLLADGWDMLVAFPPCRYLTKSNAWRWDVITAERNEALGFVRLLMAAPIPRIAIENPVGAIGTQIRPADQYIHPWWFGEPWQKMTGLWLTGLPKLRPGVTERPSTVRPYCQAGYGPRREDGSRESRGAPGSARRSSDRSRTFRGIASAMADQWMQGGHPPPDVA